MKKYIFITVGLLLFASSIARAESDENVTRRRPDSPAQAEIQEIRQDRQERRSNVAQDHANRLEKRFAFYYTRLSNIITRFEKRLDILKADGKDVSVPSAKLAEAKTKLESAKTKGMEAVAAFKAIDPDKFSEQRTEAFAARDLATAARKLFLEVHVLLKEAVRALKAIK